MRRVARAARFARKQVAVGGARELNRSRLSSCSRQTGRRRKLNRPPIPIESTATLVCVAAPANLRRRRNFFGANFLPTFVFVFSSN